MVKTLTTKKHKHYKYLVKHYRRVKVIAFFLDDANTNKSEIARRCSVKPSFVTMVLSGKRESQTIKNEITKALGFDPWAV